ncbi:MAG: aminomethyltransferase family protein [Actinomycetota bacterium]
MSDAWESPFHQRQIDLGGTPEEDSGWYWFEDFGDSVAEYEAIRSDAGLWDVSPLIKYEFKGADALAAVDKLFANEVPSKDGAVRYGPVLNEDGTMLDEGTAYRVSAGRVFLMINSEGEEIDEHFARHTHGLDVRVTNIARQLPNVAIQGPRSRDIVKKLTDVDFSGIKYFQFIPEEVTLAGVSGFLTRTGFSGELGYEFFITDPDNAVKVWDAAAGEGARPFGSTAIDLARVEAGLYVIGYDYEPGVTSPYDLSFDWAIKLSKPDFVGRAPSAETAANPPRRYKTLDIEGGAPEGGTAVTRDGEEVGTVKSPAESPRYGAIGLAAIETPAAVEGDKVEVGAAPATIKGMPIYDPEKKRPRS